MCVRGVRQARPFGAKCEPMRNDDLASRSAVNGDPGNDEVTHTHTHRRKEEGVFMVESKDSSIFPAACNVSALVFSCNVINDHMTSHSQDEYRFQDVSLVCRIFKNNMFYKTKYNMFQHVCRHEIVALS